MRSRIYPSGRAYTIGSEGDERKHQLIDDYQWDTDLEQNLFDTTPPKGYTDTTPKPPTLQERILFITESLKVYSDASGGHYPQIETFSFQRPLDLHKLLLANLSKSHPGAETNTMLSAKSAEGYFKKQKKDSPIVRISKATIPASPTTARPSAPRIRIRCSCAGNSTTAATRSSSATCMPKP